jgi:starvation-inducible outer membrane lipoprotein
MIEGRCKISIMKNCVLLVSLALALSLISCASPVFRKSVMDEAAMNIPFSDLREHPDVYKGRLFIFGGAILRMMVSGKGSLIEASYIPVDAKGRLTDIRPSQEWFVALYPKDKGLLDPEVYMGGSKITIAGEFIKNRTGRIGEKRHAYPFFRIKEIYLWEETIHWNTYPEWHSPYGYPYPYWGYKSGWQYSVQPPYWY